MERLETIIKSEEELVEAAKQKSLHTMSKEEELIEAVKRQSLTSLSNSESLGKKSAHASMRSNQRQSTSTTYPLCFAADDRDSSECSSSVEHSPPSRFDSLLEDLDLDSLDRKMPALVVPAAQNFGNDVDVVCSSSLDHPNVDVSPTGVLSSASADQIKEDHKDKDKDKEDDSR